MTAAIQQPAASTKLVWTGRVISTIAVLFLLMDGVMKLFKPKFVVDATVQLGFQENVIVGLGIVLTLCTILYVIPRTAALGALLLTGYLGGAVATHLRAGGSAFEICFPIIFGALVWGGLVLRDSQLRMHVPLRR